MTYVYQWNGFPSEVAVRCPACGRDARFERTRAVRIVATADRAYFQASPYFHYRVVTTRIGETWHLAEFTPGQVVEHIDSVPDLPAGYRPELWQCAQTWDARDGNPSGAVRCRHCHHFEIRQLDWPNDAFYQISHQRAVLWAYNREAAAELLDYIASTQRQFRRYHYHGMLRHVPKVFLSHKARPALTKKLELLLRHS